MGLYDLVPLFHMDFSGIQDPTLREVIRQVQGNFRETYTTIASVVPATAKGSIAVGNGSVPVALSVGTTGQILTVDSAAPLGVAWKAPQLPTVVSITEDYLVVGTTRYILVDSTLGDVEITLPSPAEGREVTIRWVLPHDHRVTVVPQGAALIDGTLSIEVGYAAANLVADGTNWWVV